MNKKQNLKFFLSLGNTKMVLLEDQDELQVYSKHNNVNKCMISEERVLDAVSTR